MVYVYLYDIYDQKSELIKVLKVLNKWFTIEYK